MYVCLLSHKNQANIITSAGVKALVHASRMVTNGRTLMDFSALHSWTRLLQLCCVPWTRYSVCERFRTTLVDAINQTPKYHVDQVSKPVESALDTDLECRFRHLPDCPK
jgi:hypothetical protein